MGGQSREVTPPLWGVSFFISGDAMEIEGKGAVLIARRPIVLVALLFIGCSKSPTNEEADRARILLEERQWPRETTQNRDRMKATQRAPKVSFVGGRKD
jgi:hypothetical protein